MINLLKRLKQASIQEQDVPLLASKEKELVDEPADEKESYFIVRTNNHINLVKQAAQKIVDKYPELAELLGQVENHDASKFEEPERTPYIEISWRHKLENEDDKFDPINNKGYKTPGTLAKPEENAATETHVFTNQHHPEFWDPNKEEIEMDKEYRSKRNRLVDATAMPDLAIAEMVSDWVAMSDELKKNTAREWYESQKDKRWKFSSYQEELIDKLLKVFEDKEEMVDISKEGITLGEGWVDLFKSIPIGKSFIVPKGEVKGLIISRLSEDKYDIDWSQL